MSLSHPKLTYFSLDNLAGTPTDISAYFRSASGLALMSVRPTSSVFQRRGVRRQIIGLRDGGAINLAGPVIGANVAAATSPIHGKGVALLMDEYAATAYFKSGTISRVVPYGTPNVFGNAWVVRGAPGLLDASMRLDGYFDGAASASDAIMRDLLAQSDPAVVSVGLAGFAIGSLVEMLQVQQGEYTFPGAVDAGQPVPVSAAFQADDGSDLGVALHALSAETGTMNGASVDETAATAFGYCAHLHVTAYSGFTNVTIKVQHSTDDSVWSDLVTFTAVTATGVQRSETAFGATTAVNRYVRAIVSAVTLTGSITFAVTFARRGYVSGTAGTHRQLAGYLLNTVTAPTTTYSFIYGPQGSTSGNRKLSGELVVPSYELSFDVDSAEAVSFAMQAMTTGTITEATF